MNHRLARTFANGHPPAEFIADERYLHRQAPDLRHLFFKLLRIFPAQGKSSQARMQRRALQTNPVIAVKTRKLGDNHRHHGAVPRQSIAVGKSSRSCHWMQEKIPANLRVLQPAF